MSRERCEPVIIQSGSVLCLHAETNMNDINDETIELSSGIAAFEAKEFRRAWQLLQPLAEGGAPEALYRCGIMLQNGLGVIARPEHAAAMMRDAADQQYPLAQHSLGIMHLFGEGVEQNSTEAIRLLELAGSSGLAGAWTTLAMIYRDGMGVDADPERERDYLSKAGFDADDMA